MKTTIFIILLLTASQLLAQTCFGIDKAATNVCNGKGSCVKQDFCSCFSGFDGLQCQNKASTTTCTWNKNSLTKTDFYPTADTSKVFFNEDKLFMSIKAPLVEDRLETKLYIQNETFGQCAYPGDNVMNVLDSNAPCFNRYNYSLPWNTGKNCGWGVQDTEDAKIYSGNLFIEQKENIGIIRGQAIQRFIKRVIPLKVNFKTRVTVSTAIKVFAPVNMFTAITRQEYIEGPPKTGEFDFITSLQYPFKLDTSSALVVSSFPEGLVPTLVDISDASQCAANQACTQKFKMTLAVNGACSFTGTYKMTLKLQCHPSISNPVNCPLDANRDVNIEISANSEDFCTAVNVNIDLSGTLKSYQDAAYATPKDAFLLGQTSFFRAQVQSPKATLKETKIVRVQWEQGNATKVLFDNYAITSEGTTEKFVLGVEGATTADFKFDLEKAYMDIPVDSNQDFKVSALLQVKYQAIDGTTVTSYSDSSFSLMDLKAIQVDVTPTEDSQNSKYSQSIKIFGLYEPKNNGANQQLIFSFSMFVLLAFFIVFN
jgi:hypothetical protein